jgi:glutathione S-transferase
VPTLVLTDGSVLCESAVICDYLDAQGEDRQLFPVDGALRWQALLLQGLADGAMTAMGRLFADERDIVDERSSVLHGRFCMARDATLDRLEQMPLRDEALIGEIAVAALLGYLDFRWHNRNWRDGRPALSQWFERFSARPSMTSTRYALPEATRRPGR